jgi:hypothetical protein
MSRLELTLIAGRPLAHVVESKQDTIVLSDTAIPDTVTVERGAARAHPSVDFPTALVGRHVDVRFRRRADVVTGVLESYDSDWLHVNTDDGTSHESIRRRDVSTIRTEAIPPRPIAPAPYVACYACKGIATSINMTYNVFEHGLYMTLCVQNETSLSGDATVTYIEQAPRDMPATQYEMAAPPQAVFARSAPIEPPAVAAANARADYRITVPKVPLVRGSNFVPLPRLDHFEMARRWIVCPDREPLLRYRIDFSAETPRPKFLASGRFALHNRPERVTTLNPWRSENALMADFPNDGTLAVAHVEHSDARRGDGRVVQRRFEIWNRADDMAWVDAHLVLAGTEQFSHQGDAETRMAPLGTETASIIGMMHIIANVNSQATARKEAEKLELSRMGGATITVEALNDPETGASPLTAVYPVTVPPHGMAVVIYQVATTQ